MAEERGWNKFRLLPVLFVAGILMGGLVGYHHGKSSVTLPIEEAVRRLAAAHARLTEADNARTCPSGASSVTNGIKSGVTNGTTNNVTNNVTSSVPLDETKQRTMVVLGAALLCLLVCLLFIAVQSFFCNENALEEEEEMQEVRDEDRVEGAWSAMVFISVFFVAAVVSFASTNRLLKAQMYVESERRSLKRSMQRFFDKLSQASLPECTFVIESSDTGDTAHKSVEVRQYNADSGAIKLACPKQSNVLSVYRLIHSAIPQPPFVLLSLGGQPGDGGLHYAVHLLDDPEVVELSLAQCVLYKTEFRRLAGGGGSADLVEPPTTDFMEGL